MPEPDDRNLFDDFLEEFQRWEDGERGEDAQGDIGEGETGGELATKGLVHMLIMAAHLSTSLIEDITARYAPHLPPDRFSEDLLGWLHMHIDLYVDEDPREMWEGWTEADERTFQRSRAIYTHLMEVNIGRMLSVDTPD